MAGFEIKHDLDYLIAVGEGLTDAYRIEIDPEDFYGKEMYLTVVQAKELVDSINEWLEGKNNE